MNAYFENFNNATYNSNVRTHNVSDRRFGDGLISFICALVGLFTCSAAVKLEKTLVVFSLFVAFFGVIGGIESGALSMFVGILLCGGISLVEYLTLKSVFKPVEKN